MWGFHEAVEHTNLRGNGLYSQLQFEFLLDNHSKLQLSISEGIAAGEGILTF